MRNRSEDAEDAIQRAVRTGQFDNLPGKGKPLRLESYLNEDPEVRVTNRMLRDNGYTLPWIEEMRDIERDLKAARARVARARRWRDESASTGEPAEWADRRWKQELEEFRRSLLEINRQIVRFNLNVPVVRFQRSTLRIENEIQAVTGAAASPAAPPATAAEAPRKK